MYTGASDCTTENERVVHIYIYYEQENDISSLMSHLRDPFSPQKFYQDFQMSNLWTFVPTKRVSTPLQPHGDIVGVHFIKGTRMVINFDISFDILITLSFLFEFLFSQQCSQTSVHKVEESAEKTKSRFYMKSLNRLFFFAKPVT